MISIIITLSLLIPSKQGRINSGMDLGTGYRGTICGFHTRPENHISRMVIERLQFVPHSDRMTWLHWMVLYFHTGGILR